MTPPERQTPGASRVLAEAHAVSHHDATARAEVDSYDKHVSTLRAELAHRGYTLFIINAVGGGSSFLVQRWDRRCELCGVAAVESFIARVEGIK